MELEDETFGLQSPGATADVAPQQAGDTLETESSTSQNVLVDSFDDLQVEDGAKKSK